MYKIKLKFKRKIKDNVGYKVCHHHFAGHGLVFFMILFNFL